MATQTKFENFIGDLCAKVHDLLGTTPGTDCDTLKVYLTNATITPGTHTVKADIAEISTGNGYSGPIAITNNGVRSGGTVTLSGLSVQINATGAVGPFTGVVLFNDTPTSPADPLISSAERASLTLANGESFSILFNSAAVGARGTIMTLT